MAQLTKQDYIDFLYSHIEWEHIELDLIDLINSNDLHLLSFNQLECLVYKYGY